MLETWRTKRVEPGLSIYEKPEYWNGDLGYRAPGYQDFVVNAIKEFAILLHGPRSVLDIGAAFGFTVSRLGLLGIPATALDSSRYALRQGLEIDSRRQVRTLQCVQASAWSIPLKSKAVDLIFSSGMLEHIPSGLLQQAVAEMVRVSHRGLIGVACSDDPSSVVDEDESHGHLHSRAEWQAMFPSGYTILSDSQDSWRSWTTELIVQSLSIGETRGGEDA